MHPPENGRMFFACINQSVFETLYYDAQQISNGVGNTQKSNQDKPRHGYFQQD